VETLLAQLQKFPWERGRPRPPLGAPHARPIENLLEGDAPKPPASDAKTQRKKEAGTAVSAVKDTGPRMARTASNEEENAIIH
jgi:hypothetical protein